MGGLRIGLVGLLFAACGGGDSPAPDAGPPDANTCTGAGIVYLNAFGGDFKKRGGGPETDDSVLNETFILDMDRTIAPWPNMANWPDIVSCIRGQLAPFNIGVVETDPGNVDHSEIVFSDTYWDQNGVYSISGFSCTGLPRAITFVFGDFLADDVQAACSAALGQWGTTLGIDRAFDCRDHTTLLATCGDKTFLDEDVACGAFEAETCACGGETQNSYQTILSTFGAGPCR